MAGNSRIYYPIHSISIGAYCTNSGVPVHGVQSATTNTTFSLEQVFELGQLDLYDNIENLPAVEMTIEKALDGYPLIYHLATSGATASNLVARTNQRADVFLSLFSDTQVFSSGTPLTQAYCSGMYVNSLNYTLPLDSFCRESVNLVGNDKIWRTSGFSFNGQFNTLDAPVSSGGVQRRSSVIMGAGGSVFPTNLPGITVTAGSGYNVQTGGIFGAHIQEIVISTNLSRQDLLELGRLRPYYRYANFPVAVNCSINITTGGLTPGDQINASGDGGNITSQPILIKLNDGTAFNLGTANKLLSVTYNGGATTGGVVTNSYNFENFNNLTITAPSDPMGFTS